MDKAGFRTFLQTRKLEDAKIATAIALAERFELYLNDTSGLPLTESAWAFSRILIAEGLNTEDNYITLARYGLFVRNNELYVAIIELLDGAEAQPNFYHKVQQVYGVEIRDEVFSGIGMAPLGLPSSEKPHFMHPVVNRLSEKVGESECKKLLSGSLRDLPAAYYQENQRSYRQLDDIDKYLASRHQAFIERLQSCQSEGKLFFAQEITGSVLSFVQNDPEIGGGRREGNIIYETKIPYMTPQFLAEKDPLMKRYYYCHCPWSREAIKSGDVQFAPLFCNCSGGYHKKSWEVIFEQPLKVEVLESVLMGDERCRFAIHLPPQIIPSSDSR